MAAVNVVSALKGEEECTEVETRPFQHGIKRKTGFVYDKDTEKHLCLWDPLHIEKPHRATRIMDRLQMLPDSLISMCQPIKSRCATEKEIRLVHTESLINEIKEICAGDPGLNDCNLKHFSSRYDAVYLAKDSDRCAALAAGCTLELLDAIADGQINNGLAVVRPPGHHASNSESNGFCLYNNVAIGAKHLLANRGYERILIVDWDVHHGQGTQRVFYEDNRVLYVSIHTYQEGVQWPYLRESNFDYVGAGDGLGYNINIPLNKTGLGDAEYMAFFNQIILPVAYEFNPEIVIISAGYDAAIGCPEGHMRVTPAMYGHMTSALSNLASGKVAVVLEGGYCLDSLSEGVACTLEALLGRPCYPLPSLRAPDESAVTSILNVLSVLRKYWKSLCFQESSNLVSQRAKTRSKSKGFSLPHHTPVVVFQGPTNPPSHEGYGCTPFYSCSETVDLRYEIRALAKSYADFRKLVKNAHKSGYVYDEVMVEHNYGNSELQFPPEIPERILEIFQHLKEKQLLQECLKIQSRSVSSVELGLVHSSNYVAVLTLPLPAFATECRRRTNLRKGNDQWSGDMFATEGSQPAITCASGSLLNLVDEVVMSRVRNGFAIIRPPGHHAHFDHPAGFCFANNIAVAAKHAIENHKLRRVLICDWDVHHGDGVQECFYEDPRVLFISLHRGTEDFYPNGQEKGVSYTGAQAGKGFNINIPWNQSGMTDGDYVSAFLQLVLPVAYEFAPELVLVSCGFDAAAGDPLGGCCLTPIGYSLMTRMLSSLAGGKIVLALEGGYNLQVLKQSSEAVFRALMGFPVETSTSLFPSSRAIQDIKAAIDAQNLEDPYFKTLCYRVLLEDPVDNTQHGSTSTGDHVLDELEQKIFSLSVSK